jgi:hypothetical protein
MQAFVDTSLTSITIPPSVTSIGIQAFGSCGAMTSITVASGNPDYQSDSSGVLYNLGETTLIEAPCKLTGIYTIPSSVTTIEQQSLMNCTHLTGVTIPSGVTTIGEFAFYDCSVLASVTIPSSVTSIGAYAFEYCTVLASVTVQATTPPALPSGSSAFDDCAASLQIHVPTGCVSAYDAATGWSSYSGIIVTP